jgi:hypothetical protein
VTADEPIWAGGPEGFPPSFARFQEHRERYLEARRISSERYCAELSLREALSGIDEDGMGRPKPLPRRGQPSDSLPAGRPTLEESDMQGEGESRRGDSNPQ